MENYKLFEYGKNNLFNRFFALNKKNDTPAIKLPSQKSKISENKYKPVTKII